MLSLLAMSIVFAADEGSWFDMQNCEMCKYLMEDPELLNHMAMEHHNISTGLVSITRVDPEFVDSYLKAQQGMTVTSGKLMKGEPVRLCNMCKSLGDLIAAGAKRDVVESENSYIVVMTSDKPEVVTEIHTWGERTNKEMLAMKQSEHSGHKH